MNELYAASLAASNGIGMRRTVTNIVVGVVGIAIGFYGISQGIIASFLTFIGYVGYALPAIPAIIIADYFLVQRMRYPSGLAGLPAVKLPRAIRLSCSLWGSTCTSAWRSTTSCGTHCR